MKNAFHLCLFSFLQINCLNLNNFKDHKKKISVALSLTTIIYFLKTILDLKKNLKNNIKNIKIESDSYFNEINEYLDEKKIKRKKYIIKQLFYTLSKGINFLINKNNLKLYFITKDQRFKDLKNINNSITSNYENICLNQYRLDNLNNDFDYLFYLTDLIETKGKVNESLVAFSKIKIYTNYYYIEYIRTSRDKKKNYGSILLFNTIKKLIKNKSIVLHSILSAENFYKKLLNNIFIIKTRRYQSNDYSIDKNNFEKLYKNLNFYLLDEDNIYYSDSIFKEFSEN